MCLFSSVCLCLHVVLVRVCMRARARVCVCVYVLSSIAQQAAMIAALKSAYDSETAALKESYQVVLPSLCGRVFLLKRPLRERVCVYVCAYDQLCV